MTILIREIVGRGGKAKVTGEREYDRYFLGLVPLADQPTNEVAISVATGCPRRYDPLGPQDPGAKLTDLDTKESSESLWKIAAHYTVKYGNEAEQNQPNPLLRPAKWHYETQKGTRTRLRDIFGNPYETTLHEPFQTPPETPYGTSRWTVTRNVSGFNSNVTDSYAWTVNSTSWKGRSANKVLCEGITADEQWENDYHFWTLTYIFHVDRNGWQPVEVGNCGYRYLDDSGVEQKSETLVYLNTANNKKWTDTDPVANKYLLRYPFDRRNFGLFPV
jgi:hypothetical protein